MWRSLRPILVVVTLAGTAHGMPCPNILLVVDQSGSMAQDPDGHEPGTPAFSGKSKWMMVQEVVDRVVRLYGERLSFGLEMYSFAGGAQSNDDACFAATTIATPVAHDSGGDILQRIWTAMPQAETNTNGAIRRARLDPGLHDQRRGNFILLITDGNPNCGSDRTQADPNTRVISKEAGTSLDELDIAFHQSPRIRTFVVGFDGDRQGVNTENLDNLAFYGSGGGNQTCGHPGQDHCYFAAGNQRQLEEAIDAIITEAMPEEFSGALCDDSCQSIGCPDGQICTTDETNTVPHCAPDACRGAKCDGDSFCRLGKCVKACTGGCPAGTLCSDGACVEDRCQQVKCAEPSVCDPTSGACIRSPCPTCREGTHCDVASGKCLTDPCALITCPGGGQCVNHGNCVGSGCSCRVGAAGSGTEALLLWAAGLLALLATRRRRR